MVNAIGIALSGLTSASLRLQASASNIANAFTSGSLEEGGQPPYTPLTTVSRAQGAETGGVLTEIVPRTNNQFTAIYSPDSPFANAEGIIGIPNVDFAEEAVNLKIAEITYKANLNTIKVQKELFDDLLKTFDKKV